MPRLRRRELLDREIDPVLHSGVLFKRGYGRLLGRKTWKPRHFVLTRTKLRYYTFENGKQRDEVDLRRCSEKSLEVMPADIRKRGRSPASIWRFALNVPNGNRIIMAAPTEFEMNAWVKQIRTVLRTLAGKAKKALDSPVDALPKLEAPPRDTKHHEETKEEEESCEPPFSNQSDVPMLDDDALDRPATVTWKTTTADFQNFVAQPRRSMIFRRQSFEGLPIVPGVYRNSTGQIDDRELQKELDELRAENRLVLSGDSPDAGSSANSALPNDLDDEMDEEEEEALLEALRQFSKVHSESGRPEIVLGSDVQPVDMSLSSHDCGGGDDGSESDKVDPEVPFGPVKPIFHYKKEEPNQAPAVTTTRARADTLGGDDGKWFSRVSGKFQRRNKQRDGAVVRDNTTPPTSRTSIVQREEDEAIDQPAHFHEDPMTSKPRRYSTGSMLLTSERPALAPERDSETEREEALIQELLTGLVYCETDEGSTSQRDFASPRDDLNSLPPHDAKPMNVDGTVLSVSSVDIDELRRVHADGLRRVDSFDVDAMRSASSIDIDEVRPSEAHTSTASSLNSSRGSPPRVSRTNKSVEVEAARPEESDDVKEFSTDNWFKSFKTKWRASRDEKKQRKRAAKRAKSVSAPMASVSQHDAAVATSPLDTPAAAGHPESADYDAVSVVSDLVANVPALDYATWTPRASAVEVTSPCSMTARGMKPRQFSRHATSPPEPHPKKRGIFGRWRDKRRDKQESRSRRHSTGDMIPDDAIPPSSPRTAALADTPPASQLDEAHHFSARYRRRLSKPRGLIELQSVDAASTTRSNASGQHADGEDNEEEVVVVVVRRRHSLGCADDEGPSSSHRSQKRVKYRVYVDVDEDDGFEGTAGATLSRRDVTSTMPICAA